MITQSSTPPCEENRIDESYIISSHLYKIEDVEKDKNLIKKYNINNIGGFPIFITCDLISKENYKILSRGVVICSLKDNFTRIGREIAGQRAIIGYITKKNLLSIKDRQVKDYNYEKIIKIKLFDGKEVFSKKQEEILMRFKRERIVDFKIRNNNLIVKMISDFPVKYTKNFHNYKIEYLGENDEK